MEDGSIPDDRITPSSTDGEFCALNVKGRLHEFGGWCPTDSDKDSAWFQVDLQHIELITGVITKGNNNRITWTTEFIVSHSGNSQYWTYIGGTSKATAQVCFEVFDCLFVLCVLFFCLFVCLFVC